MKRRHYIGIVSIVVAAGLLGAGAVLVGQSKVPPQAIASSVTRTPELMERAWHLPVAATFNRQVSWQSNGSRCGPAAVANAYRSLGEAASTEGKVLAATGRCWTGVHPGSYAGRTGRCRACQYGAENYPPAQPQRGRVSRTSAPLQRSRPTLHREFQPRANIWGRRRTSFADRRLSRKRGPGVHP